MNLLQSVKSYLRSTRMKQEVSGEKRLLTIDVCVEFHQHSKVATRSLPTSDSKNPIELKAAIKKSSLKRRDVKSAEKEDTKTKKALKTK